MCFGPIDTYRSSRKILELSREKNNLSFYKIYQSFDYFYSYDDHIESLSKRLLSPNYILIWSTKHFIYPQLLLR